MTRLLLILLFVFSPTAQTDTLSKTSEMMIECEAVYLWAAQLWARDGEKNEAKKLLCFSSLSPEKRKTDLILFA